MPKKIYPPELEDFVREGFKTHTARQLVPLIKDNLGIEITHGQLRAYIQNRHIRGGRRGKRHPELKIFPPEIDGFIRDNLKGTGPKEMTGLVNSRFGTSYTVGQLKAFYSRNKLNSGLSGRFKKGRVPENKGKTWGEYMSPEAQEAARKTQFKKGRVPMNGVAPIGELRLRNDVAKGRKQKPYYAQKVAQPNVWRPKHRVEWEEHNGPIPKGCDISFADGDTLNWHIENLVLETRAQNAVKNNLGIRGHDAESAGMANALADLKMAVGRAKRERKKVGRRGRKRKEGRGGKDT